MQRGEYAKAREVGDGSALTIGVVVSDFNEDITGGLLTGALETLKEWNVPDDRIHVLHVPGSFELPFGCQKIINDEQPNAVIALGCVIKGETDHDRYIADAVANGLMRVSLDEKTPISFGVITVNTLEQAHIRSTGETNKGREAAQAALLLAK